MNLSGRRESSNVEDRRGMGGGGKMVAGGGIGALILAAIIYFMGGDPSQVLQSGVLTGGDEQTTESTQQFSAEEEELAKFSRIIEASTEDIWTQLFEKYDLGTYEAPTLVLYTNQTSTACGTGTAAVGPFYCGGDQKLYIDLSFFSTMKEQLGADGQLSYAYVIAHEVGHHIEYLTGTLNRAHEKMSQYGNNSAEANKISVRLELLADFYAGMWAHYENEQFKSIEDGELEQAIDCAMKIGDDYLQKQAGYNVTVPEQFTHGTSAQRMKWFKLGYQTGDFKRGNTFELSDSQL